MSHLRCGQRDPIPGQRRSGVPNAGGHDGKSFREVWAPFLQAPDSKGGDFGRRPDSKAARGGVWMEASRGRWSSEIGWGKHLLKVSPLLGNALFFGGRKGKRKGIDQGKQRSHNDRCFR